jgi:hypothetical protein
VLWESRLCRSSREGFCVRASRLGWIGGDERRELSPDVLSEWSAPTAGDGERRRQVSDVWPPATRLSRRGLLDRCRQSPLGPVGGDLLAGKGDLVRAGGQPSYGDLDRRLIAVSIKRVEAEVDRR